MQALTLRALILLMCLAAACGPSETEQTLVANHAQFSTQILSIRETATLEAARLRTTLEAAETRVSLLATQSQFLKATAVANGGILTELNAFQQEFMSGLVVSAPSFSTPAPGLAQTDAQLRPQVTRERIVPQQAPQQAPQATIVTDPTLPRLTNAVTSFSVGQDDCPTNISSTFTTTTSEIYVSARAFNISAGTNMLSRWLLRNEEIIQHEFTAGFDFSDACIWFFIDQTEVVFEPGDWSVILYINGNQASDPVAFTISAQ